MECIMLIMKSGNRKTTEGIELPNQESIRMLGKKENYEFLGILEADTIKEKKKIRKDLSEQKKNIYLNLSPKADISSNK